MDREYNYIQNLTTEERRIFIKCFCCMVYSDKKVVKEETDFLRSIGKRYEVEEREIVSILQTLNKEAIMSEVTAISDRKKGIQLIKELCYLANSDTGLDDEEIDFIIDIAEKLNIEGNKIKEINKWVLDKIVLLKTGDIIFENE